MRCPGGSPYQVFQNSREAAAKRLANKAQLTDKGKLREEVRKQVQADCKEAWQAMGEEERA